jgi:hypothetical protein
LGTLLSRDDSSYYLLPIPPTYPSNSFLHVDINPERAPLSALLIEGGLSGPVREFELRSQSQLSNANLSIPGEDLLCATRRCQITGPI